MSEMAKKARSEMRAKAVRLAGGGVGSNDPYKPVDASSWAPPPDALDAGRKTGARPIRPRIYKHGGKIQHDRGQIKDGKMPRHPGKACRGGGFASDGRTGTGPLSMINTADENKRDFGSFHEGGYKRGGMPKAGASLGDIKKDVHKHESHMHKGEPKTKLAKGGKVDPAKHEKGGTYYGGTRPEGGRMPRASGGKTESYWAYKPSEETHSLEAAIKAKAIHPNTTEAEWGKMSPGYRREIMRTTKKVERAHGGRTKGKTNINIVIAQPKAGGGPMGAQAMPPQGVVRPPMPPPQMAPPAGGPPPMPPPGMGGPPGGMPPGAGPMMRKSGGRTTGDAIPLKDYGANSGLGRLEKIKIQERSHR